jgi:predicted RNase H-like nuclease (RuvC/YqgF family)
MNNDQSTQPTIATLLERINEFGNELRAEINELRTEIKGVKTDVAEFRAEMEEFRFQMERRIDVLSIDMNKLRADIRRIYDRFDKLEKQPA